jgi:hypothetical protein
MTASEWSSLLESFSQEAYAGGFTPEEGSRLLMWWLHAPRDEDGWTGLLLIPAAQFANCIETDTEEMP